MALPDDELRRRVAAARELRGMSQAAVNKAFDALGAGKTTAGRVERGDLPFLEMHRMLFTRVLRVPDRWFSEPDVDVIVGMKPAPDLSPEELAAMLGRLQAGHVQVTDQALPETQTRRAGGGRSRLGPEGTGA